jgi:uncharacterized protein (TIGR02453 family)
MRPFFRAVPMPIIRIAHMAHPLEDLSYPPFAGFSPETFSFFRRLKKNNNRPWFAKHKNEYEELVRFPMECLIASLRPRMADIAPGFEFHPRKSIFRVYRDTRFSNDKTPYKTNIAANFKVHGPKSPREGPGLYVGIELDEIFIGGGIYMPDGAQLKSIRAYIDAHPSEIEEIVGDPTFKKVLGGILGDRLQKAPLGYPKDHPMIEFLRLKQFFVGIETDPKECLKPKFLDTVVKVFQASMPFMDWLTKATA